MWNKAYIREYVRGRVGAQSIQENSEYSATIVSKLKGIDEINHGKCILCYMPLVDEVDIKEFIEYCLGKGIRVCLPRCMDDYTMTAHEIKSIKNLIVGKYNILEPSPDDKLVDATKIDIVILPGVAFDKKRNRLGRGAGYYDRYLQANMYKIMVAFDCQRIKEITTSDHDISVNMVLTEKRNYK